jgi:exonuclease VII small subunit
VSGSSSAVERQLPKLDVAGSIPVSRSIIQLCTDGHRKWCSTLFFTGLAVKRGLNTQRGEAMWKKQDDAVGAEPEFVSNQTPELESPTDKLIESYVDSRFEGRNFEAGPQRVLAEDHRQVSSPPTMTSSLNMTTYTEALNEFTRSATAFIEQLPLLTKARDAYEQAMRASAELRKVLDTGEENLQTLMAQLEQAVNGVKPAHDRKKPELAKVEAIRGTDESSGAVKRFP